MEYNITKEFLPVGSLVKIRFNENIFMIIGYCVEKGNKIYDYMAVRYPTGLEGFDKIMYFNKIVVKRVIHMGYESEDWFDLLKDLNEFEKNNK